VTARRLVTASAEETERAGEGLAAELGPGDVVALVGELGAGKTCFARGLVRGLGGGDAVSSPTFVLVNRYRGRVPVHHLDAYRTSSLSEVLDLGFDELLASGGVTLIEWADRIAPLVPRDAVWVRISGLGDEPREVDIGRPGAGGLGLCRGS
jgi:tRNA threonylcarbamoyladenosine biosynthesis protein TsaE